jgi:hypothetical protein
MVGCGMKDADGGSIRGFSWIDYFLKFQVVIVQSGFYIR